MPHENADRLQNHVAEAATLQQRDLLRESAGGPQRSVRRSTREGLQFNPYRLPERLTNTDNASQAQKRRDVGRMNLEIRDVKRVTLQDVADARERNQASASKFHELKEKEKSLQKKIEQNGKETKALHVILEHITEKKSQTLDRTTDTKKAFKSFIKNQTVEVFNAQRGQGSAHSDTQVQESTSRASKLAGIVSRSFAKIEKLTSTKLTHNRLEKMEDRINWKIAHNEELKNQFQDQLSRIAGDKTIAHKQWVEDWNKYESVRRKVTPTIPHDIDKNIADLQKKIQHVTKEIDTLVESHKTEGVNDSAHQSPTSSRMPRKSAEFRSLLSSRQNTSETDKAMSLIIDLTKAKAELNHLHSLRPFRFLGQRVDQTGEGDRQHSSPEDRLRDLRRSHYQAQITVDQLGTRLATNQKSLNEAIHIQEEAHRTLPAIEGIRKVEKQYSKVSDWRKKLLDVKNKLTDISDPSQSNQRVSLDDLQPNNQQKISLQKIECELRAHQGFLKQNVDKARALRDTPASESSARPDARIREICNETIAQSEAKLRQITEHLNTIDAEKEKVDRHLQSLERGDLDKATKQVYELWDKLPKDHPYFSWYLQGKYETNKKTYSSALPDSCVVCATMGTLDTLGANMSAVTDRDVAKQVGLRKNAGTLPYRVPSVIKKYTGEDYSVGSIATISELKGIVKRAAGKPVIVGIRSSKAGGHAIIVDAIKRDDDGLRRVYIRDSLGNSYGDHSYSVLLEDFEKRWSHDCIAPTKSLNWPQYVGSVMETTFFKPIASMVPSNV